MDKIDLETKETITTQALLSKGEEIYYFRRNVLIISKNSLKLLLYSLKQK